MPKCTTGAEQVPAEEDLLRAVTCAFWWLPDEGRVSTAAFDHPKFSADQSALSTAESTAARFKDVEVVVEFNAGVARDIQFDARKEVDDHDPANLAHANVYCLDFEVTPNKKRKLRIRKFISSDCIYHHF